MNASRSQQLPGVNDRTPPHSAEAEQGVLGSMILGGPATIEAVQAILSPDAYYIPCHKAIFGIICALQRDGMAVDLITLTNALRDESHLDAAGGAPAITNLVTFVPTAANVDYYVEIVREKWILRQVAAIAAECVRRVYEEPDDVDGLLRNAETAFSTLQHGRNGEYPPIGDAKDFLNLEIKLPDDIIVGFLHRGSKMVFGGGSKSFKTWQLVDLAVSVSTGSHFLGHATKKGRVLYINLELAAEFFHQRIQTVARAKDVEIERGQLHVWNLRGYAADLSRMIARILEKAGHDRYDLIVVDPIYKVLGNRDENKAGDIASLLNEIDRLAVTSGAAVVFGAHFSKGNQSGKESVDRIGGSGVFARDPDSILVFTKHEEDEAFSVDATLRNHPPMSPFVVRWDFPLMRIDDDLDPSRLKQVGGRTKQYHSEDLAELLEKPLSAGEWRSLAAKEHGMSETTFHRLLRDLKAKGVVKKSSSDGRWERT